MKSKKNSSNSSKKTHKRKEKKPNNNEKDVRKTIWEKIEKSLNKERMNLKIKRKHLKQDFIISCMHKITESINELNAHKDHKLQDQIIDTFIISFKDQITLFCSHVIIKIDRGVYFCDFPFFLQKKFRT